MIDRFTEFGQRVVWRLEQESFGWLTTVSPSGEPQPVPIWFLWQEDETVLMYSEPDTFKLRNIRANPRVAFHFNCDDAGNDVVRLTGRAEIGGTPPANEVPAYIAKYHGGMASMNMTPEGFTADYSVPILMKPEKIWGF